EALVRLEGMALLAGLPVEAARAQLEVGLDLLVVLGRGPGGARGVTEVAELCVRGDGGRLRTRQRWRRTGWWGRAPPPRGSSRPTSSGSVPRSPPARRRGPPSARSRTGHWCPSRGRYAWDGRSGRRRGRSTPAIPPPTCSCVRWRSSSTPGRERPGR